MASGAEFKCLHETVDTSDMIVIFALSALLLAVAGFGLAGLGAVMALQGDTGAGLLSLAIGVLVLYGAYLFARVAWRTRRWLDADPAVRGDARTGTRVAVAAVLSGAAFMALVPFPTPMRIIGVVGSLAVLPLLLARQFEPPKHEDG